jgi:hypothetical protein
MPEPSKKPKGLPSDIVYLLTFAAGMLGFWLSGHAGSLLPAITSANLQKTVSLGVTAAIYGLGMLIVCLITIRRIKPTLVGVLIAVILGLIAAQLIVHLAAGHINTRQDLGILNFVLYLSYGGIYVLGLAVSRRIAKRGVEAAQ